jgi:hypothetical protein
MRAHPRLVRGDADHNDAKSLKESRKRIGYNTSACPEPFAARTPGGFYRRRYLHWLPEDVPAPGGGTKILGVSWYGTSGQVVIKGGHPTGPDYAPFSGDEITELPEPVALHLKKRRHTASGSSEGAANSEDVDKFLAAHTGTERLERLARRRKRVATADEGDRHPTAGVELVYGFREAVAGWYPAQTLHDAVRQAIGEAGWASDRLDGTEWTNLVAWAVGQVDGLTRDEAVAKLSADANNDTADWLEERSATEAEWEAAHLRELLPDELDRLTASLAARVVNEPEPDPDDHRTPGEIILSRLIGLDVELPEPDPLIDGVLDLGTLALLYARWGCFKSFLAIDWGLHIATGRKWRGRDVIERPVVVLGYEAPYSLHRRAQTWCKYYMVRPTNYYLDQKPPPLRNVEMMAVYAEALDAIDPALVIVDTIARGGGGADMNTYEADLVFQGLHVLKSPRRAVLGLGHAGKDTSRGMRGMSSQEDQADIIFRLDRTRNKAGQPDGPATLTNPKQKDRQSLEPMKFGLGGADRIGFAPGERLLLPIGADGIDEDQAAEEPIDAAEALVKRYLLDHPDGATPSAIKDACKRSTGRHATQVTRPDVDAALERLEELGAIEHGDDGRIRAGDALRNDIDEGAA